MSWFNFITPIVDAVAAPIKEWQTRKTEVARAKHELILSELQLRSKLMLSEQSHNQTWEIESLRHTKRSPMQWISFLILGAPFIVAWFDPALVQAYFEVSLSVIPLWYQQMFVSIIGVVWGISSLKNAYKVYEDKKNLKKTLDTTIQSVNMVTSSQDKEKK